ncbi:class I SAM-dependent methyltransferase [Danxiaibacter flavus]|uniref:Class I SAM-dependent methyltransferase n=1 Tax=Danxiaibacter flavus TaxID=3049108 RepID=A0ABV3Z957_9BACT|nr:class I SAM-dependent methyltransferase [Chitinophagaceae bacterium DXS]
MRVLSYFKQLLTHGPVEKAPEKAYDLWAASYDMQPGNLMLDLDEIVFTNMLRNVSLSHKKVADIGCGTGRHWNRLRQQNPALLYGFDVSSQMLQRLKEKFPEAVTQKISGSKYSNIPAGFFDVIVSTLTIAHMPHILDVISEWERILKPGGDILLTDYHPDALARGGKRTFQYHNHLISIKNFIYPVELIIRLGQQKNLQAMDLQQINVSGEHRHYYEQKNALHVYEKFTGTPIVYGIHLKKSDAVA